MVGMKCLKNYYYRHRTQYYCRRRRRRVHARGETNGRAIESVLIISV